MAIDLAKTALTEMGQTSRTAIEAIESVALSQQPGVKVDAAEITEEMIAAGVDELRGYEGGSGETASETVVRIYLAMLEAAARFSQLTSPA